MFLYVSHYYYYARVHRLIMNRGWVYSIAFIYWVNLGILLMGFFFTILSLRTGFRRILSSYFPEPDNRQAHSTSHMNRHSSLSKCVSRYLFSLRFICRSRSVLVTDPFYFAILTKARISKIHCRKIPIFFYWQDEYGNVRVKGHPTSYKNIN